MLWLPLCRMQVLKRRQERELQQMMQYEVTRKELLDKQQRKIDVMEARAQELLRQKAESEKLWTQKQHELELQKVGCLVGLGWGGARVIASRQGRAATDRNARLPQRLLPRPQPPPRLVQARDEVELEREAKVMAQQRFERERQLQRKEAEEARRRKKEAYDKEVESRWGARSGGGGKRPGGWPGLQQTSLP
jgi:hypothetical protein